MSDLTDELLGVVNDLLIDLRSGGLEADDNLREYWQARLKRLAAMVPGAFVERYHPEQTDGPVERENGA